MTCTGFSAGGKCRKSRQTPPERPHVRNSQKQSGTAAKIFAAVPLFSLRRSAETKKPALRRAVSGLRTGKGVCASPQAAPSAAERRFGRTDAKTPASMLSGAGSPRGGPRTAPAEPERVRSRPLPAAAPYRICLLFFYRQTGLPGCGFCPSLDRTGACFARRYEQKDGIVPEKDQTFVCFRQILPFLL